MSFLDNHFDHNITIEDLKKIFDYNEDGISLENHKFNKFNVLLKEHKIPYKAYRKSFAGHQELFKHLNDMFVPVFFDIKVITFIRDKFKHSEKNFNFGDEEELFKSGNMHLLLLVGYGDSGSEMYFIDPVYQLPYYSKKNLSDKKKLCVLNTRAFYECTIGSSKNLSILSPLRHRLKAPKKHRLKLQKN